MGCHNNNKIPYHNEISVYLNEIMCNEDVLTAHHAENVQCTKQDKPNSNSEIDYSKSFQF